MRRGKTLLIFISLLPVLSKYIKPKIPLSTIVCSHYIVEYSPFTLVTLIANSALVKRAVLLSDYGERSVSQTEYFSFNKAKCPLTHNQCAKELQV